MQDVKYEILKLKLRPEVMVVVIRQNSPQHPESLCRDAQLLPTHTADAKEAAVIRDMNVPKLQLEGVLPAVLQGHTEAC